LEFQALLRCAGACPPKAPGRVCSALRMCHVRNTLSLNMTASALSVQRLKPRLSRQSSCPALSRLSSSPCLVFLHSSTRQCITRERWLGYRLHGAGQWPTTRADSCFLINGGTAGRQAREVFLLCWKQQQRRLSTPSSKTYTRAEQECWRTAESHCHAPR
jgi:hypothetical protein